MVSFVDDQWDIITPPTTMANNESKAAPSAEPTVELTINAKPTNPPSNENKTKGEPSEPAPAKLNRRDSVESILSADEYVPRPTRQSRHIRRSFPRRYSVSPVRVISRHDSVPTIPLIASSVQLLSNINYDGIADMPDADRSSIYLTTFPFTDRDVKKWSWLFEQGVEDVWVLERGIKSLDEDDEDDEDDFISRRGRGVRVCRNRRRNRSPFYNNYNGNDIASVFLSCALDTDVIPESTENVRYFIVVGNKNRPHGGVKL